MFVYHQTDGGWVGKETRKRREEEKLGEVIFVLVCFGVLICLQHISFLLILSIVVWSCMLHLGDLARFGRLIIYYSMIAFGIL